MNKALYIILILVLISFRISAQNIVFSSTVDNSSSTVSVVSIYAEGTQASNTEMTTFGIRIYYNLGEATVTLPSGVSYQGATNFGWTIGSNSTATNNLATNSLIPIVHTNFIEIAPFDENLAGIPVPMGTPTLFFTLTFNKAAGDPLTGGEIYIGATDTDPSLAGADENFEAFDVVAVGERIEVLPLQLVTFEAEKDGDRSTSLYWTTVNEINTSHFMVQRSTDKKVWENVGNVDAAGNSQLVQNYEFTDQNVYNGIDNRLTVYYRLQMYDLDGKSKFSPIENVTFGNDASKSSELALFVYPNPATDGIQVEWNGQNSVQPTLLELYDVTGKLVLTQKVSDNANQEYIDFGPAKMTSGLYLLRILNGSEPIEHKQIVVGQDK